MMKLILKLPIDLIEFVLRSLQLDFDDSLLYKFDEGLSAEVILPSRKVCTVDSTINCNPKSILDFNESLPITSIYNFVSTKVIPIQVWKHILSRFTYWLRRLSLSFEVYNLTSTIVCWINSTLVYPPKSFWLRREFAE